MILLSKYYKENLSSTKFCWFSVKCCKCRLTNSFLIRCQESLFTRKMQILALSTALPLELKFRHVIFKCCSFQSFSPLPCVYLSCIAAHPLNFLRFTLTSLSFKSIFFFPNFFLSFRYHHKQPLFLINVYTHLWLALF